MNEKSIILNIAFTFFWCLIRFAQDGVLERQYAANALVFQVLENTNQYYISVHKRPK